MDDNSGVGNVTSLGNFRKQKEEAKAAEPQPELIYLCTHCNCSTWRMVQKSCGHGIIECSTCAETIVERDETDPTNGAWHRILDDAPTDPKEIANLPDDKNRVNRNDVGDEGLAIRQTIKRIQDAAKAKELVFAGGYDKHGAGFWWTGVHDTVERDWIVGKMKDIIQVLEAENFEGYAPVEPKEE